jgi:hypothetical protein
MIKFKELRERCWSGYKRVPGKKAYSPGSCVKEMMGGGAVAAGPTNVTGVATSTDPVSATAVNMKKKKRWPTVYRKVPK